MKAVGIVIDSKARHVDRIFDYAIPTALEKAVQIGVRVQVPFGAGNRRTVGFAVRISDTEETSLKPILSVMDEQPLFDRKILVEAYWIKNRYFSTFAEAIKLFLPPGSAQTLTEWVHLAAEAPRTAKEQQITEFLRGNGGVCDFDALKLQIGDNTRAHIRAMAAAGIVTVSHTTAPGILPSTKRVVRLVAEPQGKLSDAATRAVAIMRECACLTVSDLALFASCSTSTVRALLKKGVLAADEVVVQRDPNRHREIETAVPTVLTAPQADAVRGITDSIGKPFKPSLLHGVTGSGKTEVYLAAIDQVLQNGGGAIVLVPEIALTHQMVGKFLAKFGPLTAVLHSGLSQGERYDEWMRIASGAARVAVGARSAVFAPCKNLQLIVIDEEHEDTYKSEANVRYHAREVAMYRAKTEGASVVLASATPSVESFYRAQSGMYSYYAMPARYNDAPMPPAQIVDMRKELENGNRSPFCAALQTALQENLSRGEQSILFLNRRGYSTFVSCRSCGYVVTCPHCSISLTYHSFSSTLNCHYCGYRTAPVTVCPSCGSAHIHGFGTGTQKIEERVSEEFPTASVIRMDVDTTRKKEAHEKLLNRFKNDNIDILLGTQMISKGLDFPNVTLVGVLNADQVLNMDDYRAGERTFDLITQVCGRAGRGEKKGRCVIQTYTPDSAVIHHASRHDYQSFYEEEIIIRKALNYPPFCDIINVIVIGHDENEVKTCAVSLYEETTQRLEDTAKVYRATPCYVNKIKNMYRWHFWMKCAATKELCATLSEITLRETKQTVVVDVNPTSI